MHPADIVNTLNQLGRSIDWLAARVGAPAEEVQRWLYGGEPMAEHWMLAVRNVLRLASAGLPCALPPGEPLVITVTVPSEDAETVESAAALAEMTVEEYALDSVIEAAKADIGLV